MTTAFSIFFLLFLSFFVVGVVVGVIRNKSRFAQRFDFDSIRLDSLAIERDASSFDTDVEDNCVKRNVIRES